MSIFQGIYERGPKYASTLLEKILPWVFFKEFMKTFRV